MYVYKHVCTGHTVYTLLAHVHVSCKHIMITQVCMWMSVWLHVMSRTDMHIIMYVQVVVLIHWGCSLEIWLKPEMLRAIYIYIYIYTHSHIHIRTRRSTTASATRRPRAASACSRAPSARRIIMIITNVIILYYQWTHYITNVMNDHYHYYFTANDLVSHLRRG